MPRGHEVNPVGVGPASLALMEMMKAEDRDSRYREIIMRGHFTTKGIDFPEGGLMSSLWTLTAYLVEIPLHVIKIIQGPNSPVRVQLWWPTFDIPREDLRDYMGWAPSWMPNGKPATEEFFLNPHLRVSNQSFSWNTVRLFVEDRFRTIEGNNQPMSL